MYSEANRRETFTSWPHVGYRWAQPDPMAQAGFYHQVKKIIKKTPFYSPKKPHPFFNNVFYIPYLCASVYTLSECFLFLYF